MYKLLNLNLLSMRKNFTKTVAVFLATILLVSQTMAGSNMSVSSEDEAYVNFDETEITASFNEIEDLVSFVSENGNVSYSDLEAENSSLIENVSSTSALALGSASGDTPPFISPFLWGCIFNWVGIVVVALTTDMDMPQIMKAVWGCVAETAVIAIIYAVYYIIVVATYGSYIY